MTEEEARTWLDARVPRETVDRLERFVGLVKAEAVHQNLIAASTIETIWMRHIVDSAQLLELAPTSGNWLDLGSGAGFPGVVVALIGEHHVTLAESRTRRVAFLRDVIDRLDLADRVRILPGRIEMLPPQAFDIISARAFAPLGKLLDSALHLSSPATRWVLPKGKGAKAELDAARGSWQGSFRIARSITDPEASIIVADQVRAKVVGRQAGSRR